MEEVDGSNPSRSTKTSPPRLVPPPQMVFNPAAGALPCALTPFRHRRTRGTSTSSVRACDPRPPDDLGRSLFSLFTPAITFRRAKIARLDATHIDHQLLQHHGGIHHPEFQRVVTGPAQHVAGPHFAHAVLHRGLPVTQRVPLQRGDHQI